MRSPARRNRAEARRIDRTLGIESASTKPSAFRFPRNLFLLTPSSSIICGVYLATIDTASLPVAGGDDQS